MRFYQNHQVGLSCGDKSSSLNPRLTLRDILAEPLVAINSAKGEEVTKPPNALVRRLALF